MPVMPDGSRAELIAEPVRLDAELTCGDGWPTAARRAELDLIAAALEHGHSVFLVGDAGVGKTRLLQAALQQAMAGGAAVARGAVAHRAGTAGLGALSDWLAQHSMTGFEHGQELSGGRRIVLGIDDAHLLDLESADGLYQLATFGRVMLIIAVRPELATPRRISRLWVERLAERIEIGPFSVPDAAEVLQGRLGGHVDVGTVRRLCEVTRGNGLFLRELTDCALADKSLRLLGGAWRWSGLTGVHGRLVDIVRLQLGDLSQDEAELVNMIALVESLDADLPLVAEFGTAAERLNRRGVLVADQVDGRLRLRLAYPLYADVIVATMPELTARRLRLADAMGQNDSNGYALLMPGVLRLRAGHVDDPARRLAGATGSSPGARVEQVPPVVGRNERQVGLLAGFEAADLVVPAQSTSRDPSGHRECVGGQRHVQPGLAQRGNDTGLGQRRLTGRPVLGRAVADVGVGVEEHGALLLVEERAVHGHQPVVEQAEVGEPAQACGAVVVAQQRSLVAERADVRGEPEVVR
jgi:hypothetical protein